MTKIGNAPVKIGVTAEPSEEFTAVANALGFVRVTYCSNCVYAGTSICQMKDGANGVYFCSFGDGCDE
jgi:hypothetical protein